MNAVARTRALAAALGAVVLLAVGACSSADDDQASSSSSVSVSSGSSAAQTISADLTTTDTSATETSIAGPDVPTAAESTEPEANTGTEPAPATNEPMATTEVPAPGNGNVNETVAPVELSTAAPVPLTATAALGGGVNVNVAGVEPVTTTAELPGEIAGAGVKVSIVIRNDSPAAVSLDNTVVDLQDSAGTPSIPMTVGSSWFTGELPAGQSATGVYLFTLSDSFANPLTITVNYSTDTPVVVFVGDAL